MSYTRRQLAKQAKIFAKLLVPTRRLSMEKRYEETATRLIKNKPDEFDKDYFKDLASRYFDLEKSFWNIQLVYILISAFLASRLLGGAEISLFGLSIKSPNSLREPLLFAVAILGVVITLQVQQLDKMRYFLRAYSSIKCPENPQIYAMKYAHFIPGEMYILGPEKSINISKIGKYMLLLFLVLFVAIFIVLVIVSGVVGIINAYDIYQNPSEYKYLSYATVATYAGSWIFSIVLTAVNKMPFSYSDYTEVNKLLELRSTNQEEHDKAVKKLSHLAFLRAGLRSPYEDEFGDASTS